MAWRPALEASSETRYRQILADPSFRRALMHEMGQPGVPHRISNENWDYLTVMEVKKPALRHLEGKIIGQLAREQKREPWDVFLDLGLEDDLDTMFDCRLFNTDEKKVSELLRHPCAAVALSDAGAHLSFLCDAGFGLHLFGHWVRERKDMTLEEAVRAVTSTVADAYRIPGRGRIAPGAWADLMLFDPATVGRGGKRRVNDLPTGASRLDTPAVGLHGVWVNGVRTADDKGVLADCGLPGRLLKEFGA